MTRNKEKTLRCAVEKWLGAGSSITARVSAHGRSPVDRKRHVCVEATRGAERRALFFFEQADEGWSVIPPLRTQPEMRVEQLES